MERAEYATGSIEVRGSGAVHRILSFLGGFFLGIGPDVRREKRSENWWDREDLSESLPDAPPPVLGRQAELFDDAGHAVYTPVEHAGPVAVSVAPAVVPAAVPRTTGQTRVSVHPRAGSATRIVTTARAVPATRVTAVVAKASAARGAVARQLMMSQSISSGREESRWFSVPQRVLLPRYQLFEGTEGVTEDPGGLRVGGPAARPHRGHVWFV